MLVYNIFSPIIWAVQKEYTYEPEWEIGVDVCRDYYSSLLSVSWKKVFYGQVISDFLGVFFFSYVLTNSWLWQILSLQEFSFVWLTVLQMYFSWFTFSDQTHSSIFLSLCYKYALFCNFDLLGRFRILQIFLGITKKLRRFEGWRHG